MDRKREYMEVKDQCVATQHRVDQLATIIEEEKQKLSWKERQERQDKYKKIDKVIDELFTEEAICVQKVEPHYIVNQPLEEQELE